MASWAAVYLVKRAGYSEKAVNGLIDMLYKAWAGRNVPRAVATSRALAANAYRRVGLNPLLSKGMPKPELMPNLKLDTPGLGGCSET